jgi:hypothetical protein
METPTGYRRKEKKKKKVAPLTSRESERVVHVGFTRRFVVHNDVTAARMLACSPCSAEILFRVSLQPWFTQARVSSSKTTSVRRCPLSLDGLSERDQHRHYGEANIQSVLHQRARTITRRTVSAVYACITFLLTFEPHPCSYIPQRQPYDLEIIFRHASSNLDNSASDLPSPQLTEHLRCNTTATGLSPTSTNGLKLAMCLRAHSKYLKIYMPFYVYGDESAVGACSNLSRTS